MGALIQLQCICVFMKWIQPCACDINALELFVFKPLVKLHMKTRLYTRRRKLMEVQKIQNLKYSWKGSHYTQIKKSVNRFIYNKLISSIEIYYKIASHVSVAPSFCLYKHLSSMLLHFKLLAVKIHIIQHRWQNLTVKNETGKMCFYTSWTLLVFLDSDLSLFR